MKKRMLTLMLAAALAASVTGCAEKAENNTEKNIENTENTEKNETVNTENTEKEIKDVSYTDALGNPITFSAEDIEALRSGALKTAVLSGSYAEIWSLAGGHLNAVTEDAHDDTRAIAIQEDTVDVGTLQSPNLEKLLEADIGLAILSADTKEQTAMRESLEGAGIRTVYQSVETFEDYLAVLKFYTELTGREDCYEQYGTEIAKEIEVQKARQDGSKPSVLFVRAFSTGAKAKGSDNMTGIMLKDLGCENIADSEDTLLDDLSMEVIIERDPDYIFVTTMGASEEAALESVKTLMQDNPAWSSLKAVQNDHYYVLPKNMFHNKPNQRWGESYKILADYLYPDGE